MPSKFNELIDLFRNTRFCYYRFKRLEKEKDMAYVCNNLKKIKDLINPILKELEEEKQFVLQKKKILQSIDSAK